MFSYVPKTHFLIARLMSENFSKGKALFFFQKIVINLSGLIQQIIF